MERALSARGVGELRVVPSVGASKLHCPDCHAVFQMIVVDGCTLESCGRCHGVWLDSGEAQRLRKLFPDDSAVVDADASRGAQVIDTGAGAISVVDSVANLLLVILR